jgi:hypothetical protein
MRNILGGPAIDASIGPKQVYAITSQGLTVKQGLPWAHSRSGNGCDRSRSSDRRNRGYHAAAGQTRVGGTRQARVVAIGQTRVGVTGQAWVVAAGQARVGVSGHVWRIVTGHARVVPGHMRWVVTGHARVAGLGLRRKN